MYFLKEAELGKAVVFCCFIDQNITRCDGIGMLVELEISPLPAKSNHDPNDLIQNPFKDVLGAYMVAVETGGLPILVKITGSFSFK